MSDKTSLKSNFLWNTFGTLFYFFTQWLLTIIIVFIDKNFINAGFLSQCMAVGNIGAMVACYGVRGYQVSDIKNKFTQSDYFTHRITNIIAVIIVTSLYCAVTGYGLEGITVVAYLLFKLTESLTDVYQGTDQKNNRMDIIGKSYIIKGIATFLAFIITYYISRNLLIAVIAMFASSMTATVLFDDRQARQFGEIRFKFDKKPYFALMVECFSPFIYSVSMSSIAALPRLYFKNLQGVELLGIYSSVAAPAVIVQMGVSYLFMPLITMFTSYYNNKDKRFVKLFFTVSAAVTLLCTIAVILSGIMGKPLLVFLFKSNPSIAEYSRIFVTTVISSFFVGMIFFLFALLVVMRKMKTVFVCSIIGVAAIAASSAIAIRIYGIDGINYAMIGTYALMCIISFIVIFLDSRKHCTNNL